MPEIGVDTKKWIDALHASIPGMKEDDGTSSKAKSVAWFGSHAKALAKLCSEHKVSVPEHNLQFMDTVVCQQAPSRRDIIDCLRQITAASFGYVRKLHLKTIRDRRKDETFTEELQSFSRRIQTIRPAVIAKGEDEVEQAENMLDGVMGFGVANVAQVSYSYFDVIPDAFYEHHGRDATPEEYLTVARSVLKMMVHIATSHDHVFSYIDEAMRRQSFDAKKKTDEEKKIPFYWPPFHPHDFALENSSLLLNEASVESIQQTTLHLLKQNKAIFEEPRVGCAGIDLFPVVFESCLKAAEHSLFRHAKRIRMLPRDLGNTPMFVIGKLPEENAS